MLRSVLAPNASPMTLDGTRTWLIGRREVVVIDPGSEAQSHLDAVSALVGDGVVVSILLTHTHPDHESGGAELAARHGTELWRYDNDTLRDGDVIETDAGALHALHTPGHTGDHVSFWWPEERAVFCGDLLMGGLDTALVAPPEGSLSDYLDSLRKLEALSPRVLHPAHGPSFEDAVAALARYRAHRQDRLHQVMAALEGGERSEDEVARAIYREAVPAALWPVARQAVLAYLYYLQEQDAIRRTSAGRWARVT